MGFLDFISKVFGWERIKHRNSSNDVYLEQSAKRIKLSNHPSSNHFMSSYHKEELESNNMNPYQYVTKRKIPKKQEQSPLTITLDDEDGKKERGDGEDSDEIVVLDPEEKDNDIEVIKENLSSNSLHSPCSSKSMYVRNIPIQVESGESHTNNTSTSKGLAFMFNKENNYNSSNDNGNDNESVQIVGVRRRPPPVDLMSKMYTTMYNHSKPMTTTSSHYLERSHSGSSFLFPIKKKSPEKRNICLKEIENIRSREAYSQLLHAVCNMNGLVTSSQQTSYDIEKIIGNLTSRPSSSCNNTSSSIHSQRSVETVPQKHISVRNPQDKSKVFVDVNRSNSLSISSSRNNSGFKFLDPAPRLNDSKQRTFPEINHQNKNDSLDSMIKRIQSIDIKRHERDISRRQIVAEKATDKVKSLEIPSYINLVDKTIGLRKVPERLQVKKVEDKLPEITPEMETLIRKMKTTCGPDQIVSKINLEEITKDQIISLEGNTWLKDNVINCYMALIMERSKQNEKLPKTYGFNTFFYSAFSEHGYARVKRWTKKVDLFSYDLLLVPIHVQKVHWCLATIDFRKKIVTYYDSMAGGDRGCLKNLLRYLGEESMDKKKVSFDQSSWSTMSPKDIPQQENGSDCGVFTSTFGEYLSRNADIFKIKQKDMPYYRKKMMVEILMKKLLL